VNSGAATEAEISTRLIPERTLATVRATILQTQVSEFLENAFATLLQFTGAHDGLRSRTTTPESPTYALYYGTFGFNEPTLVEACAVLDRTLTPEESGHAGKITIRTEAAHSEAFLPLTKRRLALPALGAAYDALGLWVTRHGRMLATIPPREVYIADVMQAADDDHVCDVAFPFQPRT
jgi:hypothetical protein